MDKENCTCNVNIRNEYFTHLKRFGVHIYTDRTTVTFVCNRTTSKGKNII